MASIAIPFYRLDERGAFAFPDGDEDDLESE